MTKTYELPNNKMLIADVDEKHHTATVSVYILDDLVEAVNEMGYWISKIEDWNKWICSNCEFSKRTDIAEWLSQYEGKWVAERGEE